MNKVKLDIIKSITPALKDSLKSCKICPRKCGVNREAGKTGYCRAPFNPAIYSYAPHHGEEPPISGIRGSGTIFFSYCNMKCKYCQNYYFSQLDRGEEITIERLSSIMLDLQYAGCHNINLVSPTHYVPQIVFALKSAYQKGLEIPIVYNTSGYELVDTIKLLKGIVDIYLSDMRYSDSNMAKMYSDAPDYVNHNRESVKQMHSQVGDLKISDESCAALRGLIIRLLVLPNGISGTVKTLKFIRGQISKNAFLSIMSQYHPAFRACDYQELSRPIGNDEYKNVVDEAHLLELNNGWIQEAPGELDPKYFGPNIKPGINGDAPQIG